MNRIWNPEIVATPSGAYSHCCELFPDTRRLVIGGQIGIDRDGNLADGIEAQCEQMLRNLLAVLDANEMGPEHLTRSRTYLIDRAHLGAYRNARGKILGDVAPPGTLLIVAGLANPDWLAEMDAEAAAPRPEPAAG